MLRPRSTKPSSLLPLGLLICALAFQVEGQINFGGKKADTLPSKASGGGAKKAEDNAGKATDKNVKVLLEVLEDADTSEIKECLEYDIKSCQKAKVREYGWGLSLIPSAPRAVCFIGRYAELLIVLVLMLYVLMV